MFVSAAAIAVAQALDISVIFKLAVLERVFLAILPGLAFVTVLFLDKMISSSRRAASRFVAILPVAYFAAFFSIYLLSAWRCPSACGDGLFDDVNSPPETGWKGVFGTWYGNVSPRDGIFAAHPDAAFGSALKSVASLPAGNYQVLFEDSSREIYGGWQIPLVPTLTGKWVLGGPMASMVIGTGRIANSYDGTVFGRPVSSFSPGELSAEIGKANVKYLYVWSGQFRDALSADPAFEEFFESPAGGEARIYGFVLRGAEENYARPADSVSTLSAQAGRFEFLSSGGVNSFVVLSRYSPQWRARDSDGNDLPVGPAAGDIFTEIVLPDASPRGAQVRGAGDVPPGYGRLQPDCRVRHFL